MTFREVTTAFHEFGHALHGLLSDVEFPRFAGTAVPRDFVEFPSQVHEMWATWPEVIENYALHYETGEPMPSDLLAAFLKTQSFNQGYETSEYLKASWIDLKWHNLAASESIVENVDGFEEEALAEVDANLALVPPRYHSTYFAHIFAGGYSAGYYSYFWSEVLDADAVEWFEERGGLKRESGNWFRETLLSRGGAEEAMSLYRRFRGSEPRTEPLLKRRGLAAN
jgi:peptidyl-dipeptidase Dcp